MQLLRLDAGRGCPARRRRSANRPARLTGPLLLAVFVISAVALSGSVLGLSPATVLAGSVAVALGGAVLERRTVGNLAAGVALRLVRPYGPGERLRIRLPAQRDAVEAEVLRVGLVNTTLCTGSGVLVVPNARLLRHAP